jgi:lysophospholipase L1-like esterase
MNKFLILALISLTVSKNVILIGDSRYVGMAVLLMGFDYSTITKYYGTGTNVRSTSPRQFNGNSIQVTAQVSASSYTFKQGSEIYTSAHNQLKKAAPGTTVLLWLGINDYDAIDSTFNFYSTLARTYTTLNFYAVPITGINESKVGLSNSKVQRFNTQLKEKIHQAKMTNLKFKSILNGNNVNSIMVNGKAVSIDSYLTSDGLHYGKSGYEQLWKAMANII